MPAKLGLRGIATQHALKIGIALRFHVDCAARAVGQRDHAVDIVVSGQAAAIEPVRNGARDCRRAVYRCDDADVVACADESVRTNITLERSPLVLRKQRRRARILREMMRYAALLHAETLQVDMIAGFDRRCRNTDDLAVFQDGPRLMDRLQRHFMSARDVCAGCDSDVAEIDRRTCVDVPARHADIVGCD